MEKRPLPERRQERTALLQLIEAVLCSDDRIVTAFLWGSLGRGQGDDLSDIDIWVIVRDEYLPVILSDLTDFAARIQTPLFVMETPYNGPVGGTCFHTLFDGAITGAHQVDWYLQPQSTARILPDTTILFDRVGLPLSDSPDYPRNPGWTLDEFEEIAQQIRFFWLMLLVCAKYAYRSPDEERMGLVGYPVNCLNAVQRFLGLAVGPAAEDLPAQPDFTSKITLLRALAHEMAGCADAIDTRFHQAGKATHVSPDIYPSSLRFLDVLEQAATTA